MENKYKQVFYDLAREFDLNAALFERLGDAHNHEIVVGGKELDMMIEIQEQLKRLEVMGDDEYRRFYIELPRPTMEEWGDCDELIAEGEYENREEFEQSWRCWNPTESRWFHFSSMMYRECRAIRFMDRKFSWFIITNESRYGDKEVTTALYKSGAPLMIYDAEKLLAILREEDYVRLQPHTFHDYMNHHDEGTVYELPWEYECDGEEDAPLTMEQYREIVELAEWEEEARVKVII